MKVFDKLLTTHYCFLLLEKLYQNKIGYQKTTDMLIGVRKVQGCTQLTLMEIHLLMYNLIISTDNISYSA